MFDVAKRLHDRRSFENVALDIATIGKPGGAQKPDCFNIRLSFKYREYEKV